VAKSRVKVLMEGTPEGYSSFCNLNLGIIIEDFEE